MTVTVCMIVKDEEKYIRRSIQSIPSNYEIVVVDTGSTDRTVQIATDLGATVYSYPWKNDFADARNYAISRAGTAYVLIIDADEVLPPETNFIIHNFLLENGGQAGALSVKNIIGDEVHTVPSVRLFPRKDHSYRGRVHEQVYNGDAIAEFAPLALTIEHYGYTTEAIEDKNKTEKYLNIYKEILEEEPDNGYILFQLGKLKYSIGQLTEAEWALKACLHVREITHLYYPVMLVMLGYVLKEQGKSREAESILQPFQPLFADFPDLFFLLGLLAMDTGNIQAIEKSFQTALDIGETTKYSSVTGVGSFKAAYNLGLFYEIFGQAEKAKSSYRLSASLNYQPAIDRLNTL